MQREQFYSTFENYKAVRSFFANLIELHYPVSFAVLNLITGVSSPGSLPLVNRGGESLRDKCMSAITRAALMEIGRE